MSKCKVTHTEPFDFAQCETHDTTFPLGDTCKFNGSKAWEVYAEEADEQRQLKVRAEMRLAYVAEDAEKLRGDIHHLIAPIIGLLRQCAYNQHAVPSVQVPHMISRLNVALSLMDEATTGTVVPDEVRGQHGVGLDHYPALVNPDSSPCINAPHWERS